ncbi:MAG TPA: hypothetical protein VFW06_00310 [Acidimicrobiia bacterium]|nr:hypothetical protein [Acidimicrobiia bacterium]
MGSLFRRLVALLVVTASGASGAIVAAEFSAADAAAARDPWRALLGRVPATGTFADSIFVNDYEAARAAGDVERTSDRIRDLLALQEETGVAPSEPLRASGRGDPLDDELGIRTRDVARDLVAGELPGELTILEGAIDPDRVKKAVESDERFSDQLSTERHAGTRYYAWGERADPRRTSPLRPIGVGGHLVVAPPYAAWSDRRASIEGSIDAVAGDVDSLVDDRDLMVAMKALRSRGGYAGFLTSTPVAPGTDPGGAAPLAPYDALAIGPTLEATKGLEIIVALAYPDATTARAQAAQLRAIAEDGISVTGTAWRELIGIADVGSAGRVVVGRFTTDRPMLWLDVISRRDSLIATV